MSVTSVRILPKGTVFEVKPGETILDAGLRHGVPLKYGCRHGNCSTCKYLVTDGEVDLGRASPYSLSEQDREEGYALLCCATPLCDLEIQVPEDASQRLREVITPAEHVVVVERNEPVSRTLVRVRLRPKGAFDFYPGQFLEIEVPGVPDEWRSYSMASAPGRRGEIDLVIQKLPGGLFSERLDELRPGMEIRIRGPFGTSYLRDGDRPVLLVAGGSGIAPMLSILESLTLASDRRPVEFYYGVRTRADLPLGDEIADLAARHGHVQYRPALSEPTPACQWEGPTAMVAQVIQGNLADASPFDAYICGPPPMCDTVSVILAAKGLAEEHAFLDRFYSAAK